MSVLFTHSGPSSARQSTSAPFGQSTRFGATSPRIVHPATSPKNSVSIGMAPPRCISPSAPISRASLSSIPSTSLDKGSCTPVVPRTSYGGKGSSTPSVPRLSFGGSLGTQTPSVPASWQRSVSPPRKVLTSRPRFESAGSPRRFESAGSPRTAAVVVATANPKAKQHIDSSPRNTLVTDRFTSIDSTPKKALSRDRITSIDSTPKKISNRDRITSIPKPKKSNDATMLKSLGRDLTKLAENDELDPLVGRTLQIDQMIQALARRRKNNPVLVGDAGVGKTAVVEGLAQRVARGDVPDILQGKRIIELDVSSLLAGTKARGDFEERMKKILDEVLASDGQMIIFIDEIHTIVGTGASSKDSSTLDAASILKPVLARGDIQCIGATTISEYRAHIEKDASLERRFQPIAVQETSDSETLQILQGLAERYENHHRVTYTEEAMSACVQLAAAHISDRCMPDKAIDVFDEVGAFVQLRQQASKKNLEVPEGLKEARKELRRIQAEKEAAVKAETYADAARLKIKEATLEILIKNIMFKLHDSKEKDEESDSSSRPRVTSNDVAQIVSRMTGVPLEKLTDDESARLLNLEIKLHKRVVGQERALTVVSKALRRARVGLKNPNRPIASFLFCGPTGVGKTELCKALSEVYFGRESDMIRLDMSEFMERHSVSKLIGSPAGYVGYGDENQLTDRVRRKPFALVLFDEVEKAHTDVLNLMLQMMEDGCLTDASGRTVSFSNTLIVLTSNVGRNDSDLTKAFSPEFLNRLDEVVPFEPLGRQDIATIADLELAKTIRRVKDRGVTVTLSRAFRNEVVKQGFDVVNGARPLRRAVVKLLDDELANFFLKHPFKAGDHIHVGLGDSERVVVASGEDGADLKDGSLKSLQQSSDDDSDSTKESLLSEKVSLGESDAPISPWTPLSDFKSDVAL